MTIDIVDFADEKKLQEQGLFAWNNNQARKAMDIWTKIRSIPYIKKLIQKKILIDEIEGIKNNHPFIAIINQMLVTEVPQYTSERFCVSICGKQDGLRQGHLTQVGKFSTYRGMFYEIILETMEGYDAHKWSPKYHHGFLSRGFEVEDAQRVFPGWGDFTDQEISLAVDRIADTPDIQNYKGFLIYKEREGVPLPL